MNKPDTTNLQAALDLAANGWNVFPLRAGTKIPALPKSQGGNGAHDGTTDRDQILKWWGSNPSRGIGANLGDNLLAFDIDINHGGQVLTSFPPTRVHISGRGNGNQHLIYQYNPGTEVSRLKPGTNVLGIGIDLRIGRGSYIVMPPTKHEETGNPYYVDNTNTPIHTLTDEQLQNLFDEAGVDKPKYLTQKPTPAVRDHQKSLTLANSADGYLTDLLANPPAQGGRNDWLTKVAGCLARKHRTSETDYLQALHNANTYLPEPLPQTEVIKTGNSIWTAEHTNNPERDATAESGWLVGRDGRLYCLSVSKVEDGVEFGLSEWADFDITAEGVAVDDDHKRTYWVNVQWAGNDIRTIVTGEMLADQRLLVKWLGAYGATINEPSNVAYRMAPSTRLIRYLNSQHPKIVHIVRHMGTQNIDSTNVFITSDGVITKHGYEPKEQSGIVLDPHLVHSKNANYHYGFKHDEATAANVLARVLTYQDETICSVYGAWWAACLLKPQISERTSMFPILGVEAASESGKTTGFFDLMVQLNGNQLGHVAPTRPVLRDYASANSCGIVWVDDLDDLHPYEELLRASTTNGVVAKMDSDNNGVKSSKIVAPIFLSGEALGLDTQKALADRSIVLNAPSPKHRTTPDGRPQWEDIVQLQTEYAKYPQRLGVLAGWYVQAALRWENEVSAVVAQYEDKGRSGSKYGVLVAGACLLDSIINQTWVTNGEHAQRVRSWVADNKARELDQDNTLTREILPWVLRTFDMPHSVEVYDGGKWDKLKTPAIIKNSDGIGETWEIWYSPTALADVWDRYKNGRVSTRTATTTALQQQAKVLGGDRKSHRIIGTKQQLKMRKLPSEYVPAVLERTGQELS